MPSRQDLFALKAIEEGRLRIDPEKGEIWRGDRRAEILDKRSGYGQVCVSTRPLTLAMAHRAIWIAAHGLIPNGLQINHKNKLRWDNRLANLDLVTPAGNQRHRRGYGYDGVGTTVDASWLDRLDKGAEEPKDELDGARRALGFSTTFDKFV